MTTLAVIDALPADSSADKNALRELITRDMVFVLAPDDDPTTINTSDADRGTIVPLIAWDGQFFWLDGDDETTAHDGVTCIVTLNSKRYKISGTIEPDAVASRSIDVPPSTPDYGDAYLVPAGSSGDWSTHEDDIAVWTSRGWQYTSPRVRGPIYVADEDAYVRWTGTEWASGLGSLLHSSDSIPLSSIIAPAASFVIRVENATTTAPPGSASVGVAYIVGPSATGAWLGYDGNIAICEAANTFTLYAPQTGDKVFNKSLGYEVLFNGTSWVSAGGQIVGIGSASYAGPWAITHGGSASFDFQYNASGATSSSIGFTDTNCAIPYTAKRAGASLRFRYSCRLETWTSVDVGNVIGALVSGVKWHGHRGGVCLLRDSVTAALDVRARPIAAASVATDGTVTWTWVPDGFSVEFWATAPDTSSHAYYVRHMSQIWFDYSGVPTDKALYPSVIGSSTLDVLEFAQ